MPDKVGLLREVHPLLVAAIAVEQAEVDGLRVLAEDRELAPDPSEVAPSGYGLPRQPLSATRGFSSSRPQWRAWGSVNLTRQGYPPEHNTDGGYPGELMPRRYGDWRTGPARQIAVARMGGPHVTATIPSSGRLDPAAVYLMAWRGAVQPDHPADQSRDGLRRNPHRRASGVAWTFQCRERQPQPVGAVARLVADLVAGLLKLEGLPGARPQPGRCRHRRRPRPRVPREARPRRRRPHDLRSAVRAA